MPIALLIVGIVLVVAAFRGTYGDLGKLIIGDLTGTPNFLVWVAVLMIIGILGYIPKFQNASRAFIALLLLVLFVANGGFFDKFKQAVTGAKASPLPTSTEPKFSGPLPITIFGGSGGGSGIGGAIGSVLGGGNSDIASTAVAAGTGGLY